MASRKILIEETNTYKKLSGAMATSKSAVSTIVLLAVAITLAVIFIFRLASIFEINKRTKRLIKETTNIEAHLTLEENKVVGELSGRNASDIAAANQMKKTEKSDLVTVDTEGSEFTRVYYTEKNEEDESEKLSVREKINRFLGLIKFVN